MAWFKVDDSFCDCPKVESLFIHAPDVADSALALWLRAGSWASKHLTDGVIDYGKVPRLDSSYAAADALVACGLWERVSDDPESDYRFHDWSDWNPTRDQVTGRRNADAARKAKGRGVLAELKTKHERESAESPQGQPVGCAKGLPSTRPDPTRPLPDQSQPRPGDTPRARDSRGGTRLSEAEQPSASDIRFEEGQQAMRDGTPGGSWMTVMRDCATMKPPGAVAMRVGTKPPPGLVDRLEESSVEDVVRICREFYEICRTTPTAKLVPEDKRDGGGTVLQFWGPGRLWKSGVWESVKALLVRQGGETAAGVSAEPVEASTRLLARAAAKRAGGAS